jgi:organic radical activating enzyme
LFLFDIPVIKHINNDTMAIRVIKIKINGSCTNNCSFCPVQFHNDPHLLEVKDIAYLFGMIRNPEFKSIYINGGEPTIHPRFKDICYYIKEQFKGRYRLDIGTNLIPLAWSKGRYIGMRELILETFDRIEVGCDDEHRNIHLLERFAPEIVDKGIKLLVNSVTEYCSEETKQRILAVKDKYDIKVKFSELCHYYQQLPKINDVSKPCQKRAKELWINCNGDAFFCFLREIENPLFNLFTVTEKELEYYLNEHDPEPYRFCECCSRYSPEPYMPARNTKRLQRLLSIGIGKTKQLLKIS